MAGLVAVPASAVLLISLINKSSSSKTLKIHPHFAMYFVRTATEDLVSGRAE